MTYASVRPTFVQSWVRWTHLPTHTPNHDDTAPSGRLHPLGSFQSAEPRAHHVDVEQLADLGGGVIVRDVVFDDTRGGDEGLRYSAQFQAFERNRRRRK